MSEGLTAPSTEPGATPVPEPDDLPRPMGRVSRSIMIALTVVFGLTTLVVIAGGLVFLLGG